MNYLNISNKLRKKENWTDELKYVHKTRLVVGFVLGIMFSFLLLLFFVQEIKL